MNKRAQEKNKPSLSASNSGRGNQKKKPRHSLFPPKPHWPKGLSLPSDKDITCFIPENLAVILSPQAFEQLFSYAYSTTSEISCLGTVKQEGGCFRIERFYLVPQTGSMGHTELDQEAVAALVEGLLAQRKSDEAHSLKCWAHSHPGMDVFWSKTDDDTCKRLVSDYLLSLVVSDDFASRCRIDVGGSIPFTIDHVPVLVEMPVRPDCLEKYAAEVREKVKHKPFLLSERTRKTGEQEEATVSEYCDTCGSFHMQGHCPLSDDAFGQEAWEEYVTQCQAEGLEPEVEEFELFGFEEEETPS